MKNRHIVLVGLFLCTAGSVSAEVLAAWHTPNDKGAANSGKADFSRPGVDTQWKGHVAVDRWQSSCTDGTYGEGLPGAPTDPEGRAFGLQDIGGKHWVGFTITNNTGADLALNTLRFDYGRRDAVSPTSLRVMVWGDLDVKAGAEVFRLEGDTTVVGQTADYHDVDLDLRTVLSDVVLADGESVTFNFNVEGSGLEKSGVFGIDNVVLDTAELEAPTKTLGLIAMAGMGIVCARRMVM